MRRRWSERRKEWFEIKTKIIANQVEAQTKPTKIYMYIYIKRNTKRYDDNNNSSISHIHHIRWPITFQMIFVSIVLNAAINWRISKSIASIAYARIVVSISHAHTHISSNFVRSIENCRGKWFDSVSLLFLSIRQGALHNFLCLFLF